MSLSIFQDDTTRVIYSFTDTDPEDITGLDYHGNTNRGTKSVILLNYNEDGQSLPEDAFSIDILVSEVCSYMGPPVADPGLERGGGFVGMGIML